MKREILGGLPGWYNHYTATGGWEGMLLVALKDPRNRAFQGRRMSELIAARGGDPVEVLFDVLLEENGSVPCVYFHHREEDMQLALRQPWCSVASDGVAVRPEGPLGAETLHPRSYGTFARVLGRYVRELKLLSLEEAVRKMTSLNAEKIGLRDRGVIRTGMRADLVVFDPATVADRATYEKPHQYAAGIHHVLVNGKMVLENGADTGQLPGRVLIHRATEP
jgi:N-acyl-D-aspartate/D-glutamate deacylase